MSKIDLNLLVALNLLLETRNVTHAAARLKLSASAMSRTLARLRLVTGDPLLVRAGGVLVPTPHAIALSKKVAQILDASEDVLSPATQSNLFSIARTFTMRVSEGFVETFGAMLLERLEVEAPEVRLRFTPKFDADPAMLRGGLVDMETGILHKGVSPELRAVLLLKDRFVGVVNKSHRFVKETPSLEEYASASHVFVSRRGLDEGLLDDHFAHHGIVRRGPAIVAGYVTAIALARSTTLVATVPERYTSGFRSDLHTFKLPVETPILPVSLFWHPRQHNDAVHAWLRGCIQAVCNSDPSSF